MDLLYIQYSPRWKWFRPPMWKIFMWAYKITDATKFINCTPVGFGHKPDPEEIEVSIKGYEMNPGTVSEAYAHWLNGLRED